MNFFYLRKKVITIPNLISIFRFGVIFILFWVWFEKKLFSNEIIRIIVVITIYTLGVLSDYVDGYWARLYQVKSKVGAFLDSLVDKFFTLSLFIAYLYIDLIQIWWGWVIAIMIREIYITGLRTWATLKNIVMVTEKHGKTKMAIQITFQSLMWVYLLIYAFIYESASFQEYLAREGYYRTPLLDMPFSIYSSFYQEMVGWPIFIIDFFRHSPNILLAGVTVFTIYSGITYILKASYTSRA